MWILISMFKRHDFERQRMFRSTKKFEDVDIVGWKQCSMKLTQTLELTKALNIKW